MSFLAATKKAIVWMITLPSTVSIVGNQTIKKMKPYTDKNHLCPLLHKTVITSQWSSANWVDITHSQLPLRSTVYFILDVRAEHLVT